MASNSKPMGLAAMFAMSQSEVKIESAPLK